jgi:hypothetical protein
MEKVGREMRWRDYPTADMWVGKAVAEALGLDPTDDAAEVKAVIKKLKKLGALKEVFGRDAGTRRDKAFVIAGDWNASGLGAANPTTGQE